MSDYKQIPGVETRFSDDEIQILVNYFQCKTMDDLTRAAKGYESLFFMFNEVDHGINLMPGDDMHLVLTMAEYVVFENFSETDQPLQRRYWAKPKRGPGRTRKEPLPDDISGKFNEARKHTPTNEAAVQRLKALGIIPDHARSLKPKTILKYMQEAEKQRLQEEQEQFQRWLDACETFKDFAPEPPEDVK